MVLIRAVLVVGVGIKDGRLGKLRKTEFLAHGVAFVLMNELENAFAARVAQSAVWKAPDVRLEDILKAGNSSRV